MHVILENTATALSLFCQMYSFTPDLITHCSYFMQEVYDVRFRCLFQMCTYGLIEQQACFGTTHTQYKNVKTYQLHVKSPLLLSMILKVSQSKSVHTKKYTFGKYDRIPVRWTDNTRISEIGDSYVEADRPADERVAIGRAFLFHLRECGVLDGYSQSVFVAGNFKPDFQCKVSMNMTNGVAVYAIRVELSFMLRRNGRFATFIKVDKETVNEYLHNCIVGQEDRDKLFEIKMRYTLALRKARCFIDDLEIEL